MAGRVQETPNTGAKTTRPLPSGSSRTMCRHARRHELTLKDDGYVFDGKLRPFDVKTTSYKLRRANGEVVDKPLEIKRTVHGPVFERADGTVTALRLA